MAADVLVTRKADAGGSVSRQLAAGVESEPAEPQQGGAHGRQCDAGREHGLLAVTDTFTENQRQHQPGHTGH